MSDFRWDCASWLALFTYMCDMSVWQLLDEMLDNGFPLATESNVLKELIRPPNILRTLTDTVTGKSTK